MRRPRASSLAALGAIAGLAASAQADLLGVDPGHPLLTYNNQGILTYNADTNVLAVDASPIAIQFMPGMPPRFVDATGNPAMRFVVIEVQVDENGELVGGTEGDDFVVLGEVDEDGDGTIDYQGVLLSGEIVEFGFSNTVGFSMIGAGTKNPPPGMSIIGIPTADEYDFRFRATGGALASFYDNMDIGVTLTSEGSNFDGDFNVSFDGGAKGNIGPIDAEGACCIDDGGDCIIVTIDECQNEGGEFQGVGTKCTPDTLGEPGTYLLKNHPDAGQATPFYGLRLDELFDVTADHDIFTFDFEAPGARMLLCYDGTSIRIYGTAFGGLDIGADYDPDFSSLVKIDMTYDVVESAPGDDDLIVVTPNASNMGTIEWCETGEVFNLFDYAGNHPFTFRFGDEDDDQGHRDFDGFSGWGWFNINDPDVHVNSADFIFTACPLCEPPATGACCLPDGTCEIVTSDDCDAQGGLYNGDDTNCDTINGFMLMQDFPNGNDTAGELTKLTTTFNPDTKRFSWIATFQPENGVLPNGFTTVVNNGPNPNGLPGELAIFFYEFDDLDNPTLTVYAYNGASAQSSFKDGNGDGNSGDADQICSSMLTNDWIFDLVATDNGDGTITVGFDIDATKICNHDPMFPGADPWSGVQFGPLLGYWFHPFDLTWIQYDGGYLKKWEGSQGWYDFTDLPTDEVGCPDPLGACCLLDGSCDIATETECDAAGGTFQGPMTQCSPMMLGDAGTYKLGNHPNVGVDPPPYGLRLDELFDVTGGHDKFTFDFEAPGTCMFMDFDGTTIRIYGTAFGGLDDGDDYDPAWTSLVKIDFTYAVAMSAPGDDDLIVDGPDAGNGGTLIWCETGEVIPLFDTAGNNPYVFRFGNDDDDMGLEGYDGLTGLGWINHHDPDNHVQASDWQFAAFDICVQPAPAMVDVLFISRELDSITDQEQARIDLFEAWGYTVHIVGAEASQDVLDSFTDFVDVAFISEEISSSDLNTKLTWAEIGIVNEEPALFDEFFVESDWGTDSDDEVEIVNNGHYITAVFDTGDIDIFNSDQALHKMYSPASGGAELALADDECTLMAVEAGGQLLDGNIAAGRRVMLPWGTNDLDITELTTDGETLMRRAIEWAADLTGDGNPLGAQVVVHWDFAEQSGNWVYDQVGTVDLKLFDDDDDIDWTSNAYGTCIDFNQSGSNGESCLRTDNASDAAALREALQATNAITVQIYAQQDDAHTSGSRFFSWSQGTNVHNRNVSIIGVDSSDDGMFDNWTRLSTSEGTFNDGPDDVWWDTDEDTPFVYTMTYDFNQGNDVRIYLNGVLIHTDTSPKGTFDSWDDYHIVIGNETTLNRPLAGELYDIKIWDGALTAAEVLTEANAVVNNDDE